MLNQLSSPPKAFENGFMLYMDAMHHLGSSQHANQLSKRKAKYPTHFKEIGGYTYISVQLVIALESYQAALQVLTLLQTEGGKKCTLK
jgi:hypothetical protein